MPYGVSPIRFVLVLPLPVFHFFVCIFLVFCCCLSLELSGWDGTDHFSRAAIILWWTFVNRSVVVASEF